MVLLDADDCRWDGNYISNANEDAAEVAITHLETTQRLYQQQYQQQQYNQETTNQNGESSTNQSHVGWSNGNQ
jgi:hypothetical protein